LLGSAFHPSAAFPAMLPRSSGLELVINLETAKVIGVDVPTPLLRADESDRVSLVYSFAAVHESAWHLTDISS
jgi:hypothetical protein